MCQKHETPSHDVRYRRRVHRLDRDIRDLVERAVAAFSVGAAIPRGGFAVIIHEDAVALMAKAMKERGIRHTTSECPLRGFTCSQVRVDPKVATPTEIMRARRFATGHQVEGLTGGLEAR